MTSDLSPAGRGEEEPLRFDLNSSVKRMFGILSLGFLLGMQHATPIPSRRCRALPRSDVRDIVILFDEADKRRFALTNELYTVIVYKNGHSENR
jgi:hypothetical protein